MVVWTCVDKWSTINDSGKVIPARVSVPVPTRSRVYFSLLSDEGCSYLNLMDAITYGWVFRN